MFDLQSTVAPVEDLISNLQLYRISSPFNRRCTALEWHPTNTNKLAVGSKGGDIILWDIESTDNDAFVHGVKYFIICTKRRHITQSAERWTQDPRSRIRATVTTYCHQLPLKESMLYCYITKKLTIIKWVRDWWRSQPGLKLWIPKENAS